MQGSPSPFSGQVLSSVGLDQSRQRIQGLLEQSAESGAATRAIRGAVLDFTGDNPLRIERFNYLVGGLELFLFSHILGIFIPID